MVLRVRRNHPVESVFSLNSVDENSGTFALGWVLEQSQQLRQEFVKKIFNEELDVADAEIVCQKGDKQDGGYTDLEIRSAHGHYHAILEAKLGWIVAGKDQLEKYQHRLVGGKAQRQRLVSVSAIEKQVAKQMLPDSVGGSEIVHLSWNDLQQLARDVRKSASSFEEKLWLRHFEQHLKAMQKENPVADDLVWIVALSRTRPLDGGQISWVGVVEEDGSYFHPVGGHWPKEPPRYIGFRYDGKLQSVHKIASVEVVGNPAEIKGSRWPGAKTKTKANSYFVYKLGTEISVKKMKTGAKIRRARQVWCDLETLRSGEFETISDAWEETDKRRLQEG